MQSQDPTEDNPANGLGSQANQKTDLPGFLAGKLKPLTAEAAPDSFAGIQARLVAQRRRSGIWLWATGALLVGGLLLALLWQGKGPATSPLPMATRITAPSPANATAHKAEPTEPRTATGGLSDDAVARPGKVTPMAAAPKASTGSLASTNPKPGLSTSSNAQPSPTSSSRPQAKVLPGLGRQTAATPTAASPKADSDLVAHRPAGTAASMPANVPASDQSAMADADKILALVPSAVPPGKRYRQPKVAGAIRATAPKDAYASEAASGATSAHAIPSQSAVSEGVLNHPAADARMQPAPAEVAVAAVPATTGNGTSEQGAPALAHGKAPSPSASVASTSVGLSAMPDPDPLVPVDAPGDSAQPGSGSPVSGMAPQPLLAIKLASAMADSALADSAMAESGPAAPATVTPTVAALKPSAWQVAFGGGAGIFNRQVLVSNAAAEQFEPTGLQSGLAISLNASLRYRLASGLFAELGLFLLHGQATLSQRQYNASSGIYYQATANGFAGAPLVPTKTTDSHLAYTLASVQAGIAWQLYPRWSVGIKGGLQRTLRQQAPYDGTPLPTFSLPVTGTLKYRLAGPIWAGAELTYFGSGPGQSNTAALFLLEYRLRR